MRSRQLPVEQRALLRALAQLVLDGPLGSAAAEGTLTAALTLRHMRVRGSRVPLNASERAARALVTRQQTTRRAAHGSTRYDAALAPWSQSRRHLPYTSR